MPGSRDLLTSSLLASDLDGTLIPRAGQAAEQAALAVLAGAYGAGCFGLAYASGRDLELVERAIAESGLPVPGWVIGDVGTTVWEWRDGAFRAVAGYAAHLAGVAADWPARRLRRQFAGWPALRLQGPAGQGEFKVSFECAGGDLALATARMRDWLAGNQVPWIAVASVDPYDGKGLLDLLPSGATKAGALEWLAARLGLARAQVVYAGDSGNDLAALAAGFRAIVVGNAEPGLWRTAAAHAGPRGATLFLAGGEATAGVLEGCRWFGLVPAVDPPRPWPAGATTVAARRSLFRVWAPRARRVEVEAEGATRPLEPEGAGWFAAAVDGAGPGTRYAFRLDGGPPRPDPCSRFQPEGVHTPSQVVAPGQFAWRDADWRGVARADLVIYELHVGTFTPDGTFAAAIERLDELVALGVTALELMPLAQTPGRWNWGYDGVGFFAPCAAYGGPDGLRELVDACHARGLGVLLDVVFNHPGPEGNYLAEFGPWFSRRHRTPWGPAFNYDGKDAAAVRAQVVECARRWLVEFHLDGLRLDAVRLMHDSGVVPITAEIAAAVDELAAALGRPLHVIAESNVMDSRLLAGRGRPGGSGIPLLWCDDLAHALHAVALGPRTVAGRAYAGSADLANCLGRGYLFEWRDDQPQRAGPTAPPACGAVVQALQTHDLVGNHPLGLRFGRLAGAAAQRCAAALVLLHPALPLLFMGEEFASPSPFCFFTDFADPALRRAVVEGRRRDYPEMDWSEAVPPVSAEAFLASKLPPAAAGDAGMLAWYRSMLALRRRWRAAGWLAPELLVVRHDESTALIVLEYWDAAGRGLAWVAARPGAAGGGAIGLAVDGTIEAHSGWSEFGGKRQRRESGTLRLAAGEAAAGTGVVSPAGPSLTPGCLPAG
jgi:maltooligosyltrehalose trehalohydrolase